MKEIGPIDYFRCGDCGFVFSKTHSELAPKKWSKLNVDYHHYNETDLNARAEVNQPPYAEQSFLIALLKARNIIDSKNMLDFAAGYGTLSNLLKELYNINLPIYDPYVKDGDLSRYVDNPIAKSYSVVISSAYFEHIRTRSDLDEVNSFVADDGCLILHTVICANIPADPDWFYLSPPVHTAFHTNKSMGILMEQWGYKSSLYSPQAKCWLLLKKPFSENERNIISINRELHAAWLFGKDGFMDYWKGF